MPIKQSAKWQTWQAAALHWQWHTIKLAIMRLRLWHWMKRKPCNWGNRLWQLGLIEQARAEAYLGANQLDLAELHVKNAIASEESLYYPMPTAFMANYALIEEMPRMPKHFCVNPYL